MTETVLVTGCSSGVGRATTRAFLADGWRVYATARHRDDLAALEDLGAETAELDVTSASDAERAVEQVLEEADRLDCLVNNAGYGQFGAVEDVPPGEVREQFEVNTFGPHRLMRAAIPHMRERGGGTIVNVTSAADGLALAGIGVYNGSKVALSALTQAARQEVADDGIDVVAVEPGVVATPFYERALAELDETDRSKVHADLYRALARIGIVRDGGPLVNDPRRVAETILTAANVPDPAPRYRVGALSRAGALATTAIPEAWRDRLARLGVRIAASDPVQRLLDRSDGERRTRPPRAGDD